MNVNLNSIGADHGTFGVGAGGEAQGATQATLQKASSMTSAKASVGIQAAEVDVLQGSEPIADVPEGELVRDDALGRLVASSFTLPAPPMPDFSA